MWKFISIRLATSILMDTPAYQSSTQEKIRFQLERAFVPNLVNYKVFGVNDMMEDIILIEGVAFDYNTRDCYTAPCYIPRTVQKIVLPRSSQTHFETTVETKLLIIPAKDVDEFDIMEREEEISEMVSTASAKCLQHVVQSRASKLKRKKKRQTTFGMAAHRRAKYGDSRLSTSQSMYYSRSGITNASSLETELQNISMNEQEGSNAANSYVINERDNRRPTQDRRTSKVVPAIADRHVSTSRRSSVPVEKSLNVEKEPSTEQDITGREQIDNGNINNETEPFNKDASEIPKELNTNEKRIRKVSSLSKQDNLKKAFNNPEHRKSDSSKKSVQLQNYEDKNYGRTSLDEKRLSNRANSQDLNTNERRKTMTLDDLLRQKIVLNNLRKSEDSGTTERKTSDEVQQLEKEQKSELFADPKEEIKYERKSLDYRFADKQQKSNNENIRSEPKQSDARTSEDREYLTKQRKEEIRRQSQNRRSLGDNRPLGVIQESDTQEQNLKRNVFGSSEILDENDRTAKENMHINTKVNEKYNKFVNDRRASKDGRYFDRGIEADTLPHSETSSKKPLHNLAKPEEDSNANQKKTSDVVEKANDGYKPEFSDSIEERKSRSKPTENNPSIRHRNSENLENDQRKERQEIHDNFGKKGAKPKKQSNDKLI